MALEAARAAGEGSLEVSDAVFGRALALPEESEQEMQLVLTRDGSRGERFAIYGRVRTEGQEGGWTLHASGEVGPAETSAGGEPPSFDAIRGRCRKEVDGPAFYEALARRKIELGPSFRRIERAWVGEERGPGASAPCRRGRSRPWIPPAPRRSRLRLPRPVPDPAGGGEGRELSAGRHRAPPVPWRVAAAPVEP